MQAKMQTCSSGNEVGAAATKNASKKATRKYRQILISIELSVCHSYDIAPFTYFS
jgi:hypothetical protein